MKDPYLILQIYNLYIEIFRKSPHGIDDFVLESEAWTRVGNRRAVATTEFYQKSVSLIDYWYDRKLNFDDYEKIKNLSSELIWPLQIAKASICEIAGQFEMAIQNYRYALAIMPSWIPEAKVTYEKLNELRNRKVLVDGTGGADAILRDGD